MKNSRHVAPNSAGGWSVHRRGAAHASKRFKSEAEAITYAARAGRAG